MSELLILKTGTTYPELAQTLGDFDQWVLQCMPQEFQELCAVGDRESTLPSPETLRGIIITGSHSMVTRPSAWERKAMHWVRWALDLKVPILGICYGHQMLGQLLGGSVGFIPGGPEIGYQRLAFSGDYESDPLFGLYPSHIETFTWHYQTILRLPPAARVYARSRQERQHAVRFADWVWGVQYHPEFSREIAASYLRKDSLELERHGMDPDLLLAETRVERPPDPLITRFAELSLSR